MIKFKNFFKGPGNFFENTDNAQDNPLVMNGSWYRNGVKVTATADDINKATGPIQDVFQITSEGTTTEINSDMKKSLIGIYGSNTQTLNFSVPTLADANTPYRSFRVLNSSSESVIINFAGGHRLTMLPLTSAVLFFAGDGESCWFDYFSSYDTTGTGPKAVLSLSPTIRSLVLKSTGGNPVLSLNGNSISPSDHDSFDAVTTDATPTTIRTITLETGASKTVRGTIKAFGDDFGISDFSFGIKNIGGNNSAIGEPNIFVDSDSGNLSIILNHDGADTEILVNGTLAANISWSYDEILF